MKQILLFCLAVLTGAGALSTVQAADPGCKPYKVNAPILYIYRNIGQSGDHLGQIESGTDTCISHQVNIDNQQWGFITHKLLAGGQKKPVNGWIRLEFMKSQSPEVAATPAANPAVQPAPAPVPPIAAPPVRTAADTPPNVIAPSCPTGFVLNAGKCARPAVTAPAPSCPAGFVFSQGQCVTAGSKQPSGGAVAIAPAGTVPAAAAPASTKPQLSPKELTLAIQQELARLGCNPGRPDGDWGRRTVNAVSAFNRQTNLSLETAKPNADTLPVLKSTAGKICTSPPPRVKPVSTGYTAPKKKAPSGPPKKKKKSYGDESLRVDCESGRKVTADCF